MQTTQLQTGIAVQQETQGDMDFYVPDGTMGVQKLSPSAVVALTNYDAIVGPALTSVVQYTSIQTALNAVGAGGRVLVLAGTYTGAVTISSPNVFLQGQGYGCLMNGAFTVSAAHCSADSFRITGNITMTSGTGNKNFAKLWQDSGFSVSDLGTDNDITVIQG